MVFLHCNATGVQWARKLFLQNDHQLPKSALALGLPQGSRKTHSARRKRDWT